MTLSMPIFAHSHTLGQTNSAENSRTNTAFDVREIDYERKFKSGAQLITSRLMRGGGGELETHAALGAVREPIFDEVTRGNERDHAEDWRRARDDERSCEPCSARSDEALL